MFFGFVEPGWLWPARAISGPQATNWTGLIWRKREKRKKKNVFTFISPFLIGMAPTSKIVKLTEMTEQSIIPETFPVL